MSEIEIQKARARVEKWIRVYVTTAAPADTLGCSFEGAPLYLSDIQTILDALR